MVFKKTSQANVFGKIVENVRNHIRLKLVATAKSKNKSASVPNTIHQNNSRKNCWQFKGKNKCKNKETNESEFVISRSKQESIYEDWYDYVKHIGIRLNYASKIRTIS